MDTLWKSDGNLLPILSLYLGHHYSRVYKWLDSGIYEPDQFLGKSYRILQGLRVAQAAVTERWP